MVRNLHSTLYKPSNNQKASNSHTKRIYHHYCTLHLVLSPPENKWLMDELIEQYRTLNFHYRALSRMNWDDITTRFNAAFGDDYKRTNRMLHCALASQSKVFVEALQAAYRERLVQDMKRKAQAEALKGTSDASDGT